MGNTNDAVFLYLGILDAYEAIAEDLIGGEVLKEEVAPRMIFYVRNFLPSKIRGMSDDAIQSQIIDFLDDIRNRVYAIQESDRSNHNISMSEIWELRAAIFGFENVFLDILGEDIIESYVYKRIAEILAVYLPEVFNNPKLNLEEKLKRYSSYLRDNNFVKQANFAYRDDQIQYRVNYCAFSSIHNSSAYLDGKTRFCPWGMIAKAIVASSQLGNHKIRQCKFTTRGSITDLEIREYDN